MSLLPKDLENMLGTKEEFEEAQKKRDAENEELKENMEENNCLDLAESQAQDEKELEGGEDND